MATVSNGYRHIAAAAAQGSSALELHSGGMSAGHIWCRCVACTHISCTCACFTARSFPSFCSQTKAFLPPHTRGIAHGREGRSGASAVLCRPLLLTIHASDVGRGTNQHTRDKLATHADGCAGATWHQRNLEARNGVDVMQTARSPPYPPSPVSRSNLFSTGLAAWSTSVAASAAASAAAPRSPSTPHPSASSTFWIRAARPSAAAETWAAQGLSGRRRRALCNSGCTCSVNLNRPLERGACTPLSVSPSTCCWCKHAPRRRRSCACAWSSLPTARAMNGSPVPKRQKHEPPHDAQVCRRPDWRALSPHHPASTARIHMCPPSVNTGCILLAQGFQFSCA